LVNMAERGVYRSKSNYRLHESSVSATNGHQTYTMLHTFVFNQSVFQTYFRLDRDLQKALPKEKTLFQSTVSKAQRDEH